jgi:hypothetical protein
MKRILILLMLHITLTSFAQEPAYTPMNLNYKFKGIRVDSLFLIPSFVDTSTANGQRCATIPGSLIRTQNDFWMRNSTANAWLHNVNVGNGANPAVQFLDSIKRRSDSVFMKKNGTWLFAFKDSVGGGGTDSPNRIDGIATSSVNADMDGFTIQFLNVNTFTTNADYINLNSLVTDLNSTDSIILRGSRAKIKSDSLFITKLPVALPTKDTILSIGTNGRIFKQAIGSLSGVSLQDVLDYNHDLVDGNNFQGSGAGNTLTDVNNICIGDSSGSNSPANTIDLVAIGKEAGKNMSTATQIQNCVFVGNSAGKGNDGSDNVFVGNNSGYNNTKSFQIGIGSNAANSNSGQNVIGIGKNAARANSADNVIEIGNNNNYSNTGSNAIIIGNRLDSNVNTFDNVVILGHEGKADQDDQIVFQKNSNDAHAKINTDELNQNVTYKFPKSNGHLLANYSTKTDLDALGSDYYITNAGVYTFTDNVGNYKIHLPLATDLPGQMIVLTNFDASNNIDISGGGPIDRGDASTTLDVLYSKKMIVMFSNGQDWVGYIL